jgi:UDP-2-acetamido-3-amino-2,3-dideoxy-glucuronate N-acetyltransferase
MVFTNIINPKSKYPQRGNEFYVKTLVKEGASIGANATILCGNTIGKHAVVGAGAVVIKDVPDYALIVGVPAKQIGWVSEAGVRLKFDEKNEAFCEKSNKKYKLADSRVTELD